MTPPEARIAVFLPNRVGDAIQATPALRALRHGSGGQALITGVGPPAIGELLEGLPFLDSFLVRPAPAGRLERLASTVRLFRTLRPDLALLLTNDRGSAAAAWLARVPSRIGADHYGRGSLLTRAVPVRRERGRPVPVPMIEFYLDLAREAGYPGEDRRTELATTRADEAAADRVWTAFGPGMERPVAVLANASASGPAKLWPVSAMAELARRLVRDRGLRVLLLHGPGEEERARQTAVAAGCGGVCTLAPVPASIGLAKACIRRARLLVSTDSGPRHMGPALGVPTVSLFGPTDPAWTDPGTPLDLPIRAAQRCPSRQGQSCAPQQRACMNDLTVDSVWLAVEKQLERGRA